MKSLSLICLTLIIMLIIPPAWADTLVVYPADTLDGAVYRQGENATFTDLRTGSGTGGDYGTDILSYIQSALATDRYYRNYRGVAIFNTSDLPDDATISSATLSLYGVNNYTQLGDTTVEIVKFTIDGTISAADYDNFDTTPLATGKNVAEIVPSVYANFSLNDRAIENISKTGSTGIGVLSGFDLTGTEPTWASGSGKRSGGASSSANTIPGKAILTIVYSTATTPVASFTKSRPVVRIPQSVTMTDTSTNTPTAWQWSWGDGTPNATTQNPSHTYKRPGYFKIILTASNAAGQTAATSWIRVYNGFSPYRLTLQDPTCFDLSSLSFSREITEYERTMTIEKIKDLC